ncbi:hypothetical protein PIB30_002959 [Stylosanthes scabra]|uniref:Uncharacterized protein n=1 Tax=Stylosanthes scabra TaxID=79078 RepID=A0ABU6V6A6_9FABA|nr:hypothetical protein [Stylosanthes scabra]
MSTGGTMVTRYYPFGSHSCAVILHRGINRERCRQRCGSSPLECANVARIIEGKMIESLLLLLVIVLVAGDRGGDWLYSDPSATTIIQELQEENNSKEHNSMRVNSRLARRRVLEGGKIAAAWNNWSGREGKVCAWNKCRSVNAWWSKQWHRGRFHHDEGERRHQERRQRSKPNRESDSAVQRSPSQGKMKLLLWRRPMATLDQDFVESTTIPQF